MSKVSVAERATLETRAFEIVKDWSKARSIVRKAMEVPFRASEDFWMGTTLESLIGSYYVDTLATVENLAKHEAKRKR
jgi:hypothetical protein